jgi:hypothetical protein
MRLLILSLTILMTSLAFGQIPPPTKDIQTERIKVIETIEPVGKSSIIQGDIATKYAESITAKELKSILTIVASDEMQGRETASAGQKKAEQYLVSKIKSFGIPPIERPGVKDGYLQMMPFTKESWGEVNVKVNGKEFQHLRDFYCFRSTNMNLPTFKADEVIFLGYGIDDAAYSDYKNVDVAGKVIMIFGGEPTNKHGVSWISGTEKASNWASNWKKKLKIAKEKGVKTVLMIDPKSGDNIGRFRRWLVEPSLSVGLPETEEKNTANSFYISPEMAMNILGKQGKKLKKARKKITKKGEPYSFAVKTELELQQEKKQEITYSSNVMAFIEGKDEKLKDEIVVISAHYDHLGIRGEDIYNGADDNGSGTTALIEMAQAYAQAKADGFGPNRSVLLIWVSGEEKGLLGSKYYVENPIFPLENTVVDVNVDMIGRVDEAHVNNPRYIYVIGSDRLSSELHEINETANTKYTNIELDYTYNAEDDPNRYYYRSDHYNFAELGIPAIFYFSGVHEDYHKITDTVEKIQFDKMAAITKLVFYTSWQLANQAKRIEVDK